jgi:hypothetical protein
MCGAGHHDPGAQKRHLAAEMTHHNVPFRRQWKRDAAERLAEVPPWVWGLLMLTVFSAFVAVLGVGLLAGGSHAGVFVLLGGAAVVATVVAYWVEGMTDGGSGAGKPKRVQAKGAFEHVPDRVGSAVRRGLLGVRAADGPQTESHGDSGAGSVVRTVGRHRVVYRMPGARDSNRVTGDTVRAQATATTSAQAADNGPDPVAA